MAGARNLAFRVERISSWSTGLVISRGTPSVIPLVYKMSALLLIADMGVSHLITS